MKKTIFLFVFLFQLFLSAQSKTTYRDSSYTAYSTYIKEIKNYPFVRIVNSVIPDSVNVNKNIEYVSYGSRNLSLDLFSTTNNDLLRPAVILIHGGGWRTGDKSLMVPIALKLAEKGYIAITVEYRLAGEAIFPAAVKDIKNSIKWLKKNAIDYRVDTNRISLLGCSAGGQLASLVGYSKTESDFEDENYPDFSSRVNAVLNIDGLMDFLGKGSEEFDKIPNSRKPRAAHHWLGASQIERPDLWEKASPVHYITQDSPPIIFINSSKPRFHAGRDEAIEILKENNIYYEVYTIDNTPHSFWLFYPWFKNTVNHVLNFLKKY